MSTARASPTFVAIDSWPSAGPILVAAGVTRWAIHRTRRPLVAG